MAYSDAVLALSGLVGYWKLDEAAGTTAEDSGPNGLDGSYVGSPTLGVDGLLAGDPGGTCVDLPGGVTAQYVSVPDSAALSPSQVSVVAWVHLDSYGGANVDGIVTKQGSFWLTAEAFSGINRIVFHCYVNGTRRTVGDLVSDVAPAPGQTIMVAGTFDGSTLRRYINDDPPASASFAGVMSDSANPLLIGRLADNGRGMDGRVDEIAVFNRALTAQEIADLYTAGVTQPTIDIAIGRATETDTSRTLTAYKTAAIARAQESDQPRALTLVKTLTPGRAVEQAAARTVQAVKSLTLGRPTEAATARPLTVSKQTTLGRAAETTQARAVTATKVIPLGRATETNTARQLTLKLTGSLILRRAAEQDQARSLTATKTLHLGRATEANRAGALTIRRNLTLGRAVETTTARTVTLTKTLNVGRAQETDTARALTVSFPGRATYSGADQRTFTYAEQSDQATYTADPTATYGG